MRRAAATIAMPTAMPRSDFMGTVGTPTGVTESGAARGGGKLRIVSGSTPRLGVGSSGTFGSGGTVSFGRFSWRRCFHQSIIWTRMSGGIVTRRTL